MAQHQSISSCDARAAACNERESHPNTSPTAAPTTLSDSPLPFPLESYICRKFLRTGNCPHTSVAPFSVQSRPPSTTSSSSSSSVADAPTGVLEEEAVSQRQSCRYLHVAPSEILSLLSTMVTNGRGFVVGCKDFQCRASGCHRSDPSNVMCRHLHLTSEEEAEWLSRTSTTCKALRDQWLAHETAAASQRRTRYTEPFARAQHQPGSPPPGCIAVPLMPTDIPAPSNTVAFPHITVGGSIPQVCRQFLQGRCFRGGECRFRHVTRDDGHAVTRQQPQLQRAEPAAVTEADAETAALERVLQQLLADPN